MDQDTEIRKMCPASRFGLVQILEISDSWKKLMAIIPQQLESVEFKNKYTSEHIRIVERHCKRNGRDPSAVLLDEWGITGRNRPRIRHLLELLIRAELYRAADFVAVDILKGSAPERPKDGPAAKVCVDERLVVRFTSSEVNNIDEFLNNMSYPNSVVETSVFKTNEQNPEQTTLNSTAKLIVKPSSNIQTEFSNSRNETENSNHSSNQSYNSNLIQFSVDNKECNSNLIEFSQTECNISISRLLKSEMETETLSTTTEEMPEISFLLNDPDMKNVPFNMPTISVLNMANNDESRLSVDDAMTESLPQISIFNNLTLAEEKQNSVNNDSGELSDLQGENNLSREQSVSNLETSNYLPKVSSLNIELESDEAEKESNAVNMDQLPILSILNITSAENCESERSASLVSNQSHSRSPCASPLPQLSLNTLLPHFTYAELQVATNGFDETPYNPDKEIIPTECLCDSNGRQLGSGAFGAVYLAFGLLDEPVAVKKLHLDGIEVVNEEDTITKQFKNEVELLCKYKHPNLLALLGYSYDGPTYCLLYEYVSGGSLDDRLLNDSHVLEWPVRISIAFGTANGVAYLHTAFEMPLIHRDIKSANILLDYQNTPKLCDFGLIRLQPNQQTHSATTVFGTSAYMAPEAFRGDVSIKIDTFSFGVVLLELLTALPPLDNSREGTDLVTHVEDNCEDNISPLLDLRAGCWKRGDFDYSADLFSIANLCLEEKKRRPTMTDIYRRLEELYIRIQ